MFAQVIGSHPELSEWLLIFAVLFFVVAALVAGGVITARKLNAMVLGFVGLALFAGAFAVL